MSTSSVDADHHHVTTDEAWANDELRLALAMRGGVSLAVWIGGAAAEIDDVCRARSTGDAFWTRLCSAAGYRSVIVDVMSGASAGGLNAIIGAAAATYDFSLEALRDTWLALGSLSAMVRRADRPGPGDGLSLLEGDEYFLANLHDRLVRLVERAGTGEPRRIDVTLAATLLEPISTERIRDNADTTHLRYTSAFRFRHGSPVSSDFPRDDAGRNATLARLALAGRATSSFPAAFEAAAVQSPRPPSFTAPNQPQVQGVDMTGVFGEATATGRTFCVMDGGVLDNIPIARAIDAIVDAPADRPTRRVLVYVQPGSSGTAAPAPVNDPDRSTAAVLNAIIRTRVQEETIAGDLRQLDAHNARVRRSRLGATGAVRQLTEATAEDRPQQPSLRYVAQRTSEETSTVAGLLDDPIAILGGDPFPQIPDEDAPTTDRRWRSPLSTRWETAWVEQLPVELAGRLQERLDEGIATRGHALTVGVGPLRRLTHLLIDACRTLSRCGGTSPEGDDPDRLKASLYRLLAVHAELVERPRMWAWVTLAVRRQPNESRWARDALDRIEALSADCSALAGLVDYVDAAAASAATPLARADQVMRERIDDLMSAPAGPPPGTPTDDVRAFLLQRLCAHADTLARADLDEDGLDQLVADSDLGAAVLAWLRQVVQASNPPAAAWERSLALLEQATYDPETVGELGSGPIDFVRLSGANPTPLAAAFPRLIGELPCANPYTDIAARLTTTPDLGDATKLAGNELMNFSAFLRPRWRANDWMWGRLDAVVTLVEILVQPARLRALAEALQAEEPDADPGGLLLARFRTIVTTSGAATSTDAWRDFLEQTAWQPRRDDIATAFARLLTDNPEEPPDLAPLRAAVVAARQWELLAILLPLGAGNSRDDQGAPVKPKPISPQELVEVANEYWVGVETLGDPRDPNDGPLVRSLANAARSVLAHSTHGAVGKLGRVLAPLVGLLSRIWLNTTRSKVIAAALLAVGLAGLTVPAAFVADGPLTERVLAAAAGPAAVLFLIGVIIAVGHSMSLGFLAVLVAIFGGLWAGLTAGLAAFAISIAIVAFVTLVAGATLVALIRLRPSILS